MRVNFGTIPRFSRHAVALLQHITRRVPAKVSWLGGGTQYCTLRNSRGLGMVNGANLHHYSTNFQEE
jgi:hypothetical protein